MKRKLIPSLAVTCATLFLSSTPNLLAQETPASPKTQLTVGSEIPQIEGFTWLKGEPVKNLNEKGKVYMLELWATWCGPCIQIIPHVNHLHTKYKDKGLVVIGLNIFEDDLGTVKKFVTKQGDGMSYRVAFSGGEGSHFEKNWIQPAGITGIPHAILIKDGKIIFSNHPAELQDATIEAMLKPDFDAVKYAAEAAAAQKAQQELQEKIMPLFRAEDWDGLLELANSLDDSVPAKIQLQTVAAIQKADWDALLAIRSKVSEASQGQVTTVLLDETSAVEMQVGKGAKEYALAALGSFGEKPEGAIPLALYHFTRARLSFLAGKTDEAKTSFANFEDSVTKAEDPQFKAQMEQAIPVITKDMTEGKFPSLAEVLKPQ